MMSRRRLQNAAISSRQFMVQRNHLGEQNETPNRACSFGSYRRPTSEQLKELLKARQARANFFGAHLFADPAWDILLQVYVALLDKETLLVSTLLRTSSVPATTMLRWVRALEQDGWLEHNREPLEHPQSFLKLSAAGKLGMERYLASVWPSLPL
jgi:hypothetical protein